MALSVREQEGLSRVLDSLPEVRDHFDRVADYFGSARGAWDLFRVVDHALEWVRLLPLAHSTRALTTKMSRSVSLAGTSLSIPTFFSDANDLRKKVIAFSQARAGARNPEVLQAGKDCLNSGVCLTNTVFQAILFAHEAKLINLDQKLPVVNFVYQTTWLAADTAELLSEAYQFSSNFEKSPEEAGRSLSAIIQSILSIAVAAITLVGTVFGAETIEAAAPLVLVFSTGWLIAKLSANAYKLVLDDQKTLSDRKVLEVLVGKPA